MNTCIPFLILFLGEFIIQEKSEYPDTYHDLVVAIKNQNIYKTIDYIYEGDFSLLQPDNSSTATDFNGHYTRRIDTQKNEKSIYIELYERKHDELTFSIHKTMSLFNNETASVDHKQTRKPRPKDIRKSEARSRGNFALLSSPELYFPADFLSHIDQDHQGMALTFKYIGLENHQDNKCIVFEMDPNIITPQKGRTIYKYFFNVDKKYLLIKYEKYMNSKLVESLEIKDSKLFNYANKAQFWYPTKIFYCSYMGGPKIGNVNTTPTVTSTIRILSETIQLDKNLSDDNYAIYRNLTAYNKLTSLKKEVDFQNRVESRKMSKQEVLEQQLVEVNQQSNELHADKPAYELNYVVIVLACSLGLSLIVLLFRYRKSAS